MAVRTNRSGVCRGGWAAAIGCLCTCLAATAQADGTLVIAGGALRGDNAPVYRAFLDALPAQGPVVIIPVASGNPAKALSAMSANLERHGFTTERLAPYPLAQEDDTSTPGLDESQWAGNAWDPKRVQSLGRPAGIWFTGGDQVRITRALVSDSGEASPLLKLIRQRLAEGAVVGGTSAGAAIMTGTMITGGNSFEALLAAGSGRYSEREEDESGRISLAPGLGLLPAGIVDQHFDRRARLGRLVRAMSETGETVGYVVDENTALYVDLSRGRGRVLGQGSVTVIDARNATFGFGGNALATGLRLSVVPGGVVFSLADGSLLPGQGKATRGDEYYGHTPRNGGGMALPNPRLNQLLGNDLLDNRRSTQVQRLSCDDRGRGLRYDFSEDDRSQGYWFEEAPGESYALVSVRLDIVRLPGACAGAVSAGE